MRPFLTALIIASLLADAPAYSQSSISLDYDHVPLTVILGHLCKKDNCWFMGCNADWVFNDVSVHARGSLSQVLQQLFKELPITYTIDPDARHHSGLYYVQLTAAPRRMLRGRVFDIAGEPQTGISITLLHTDVHSLTNSCGRFQLDGVWNKALVHIEGVNIQDTIAVVSGDNLIITVRAKSSDLPKVTVNSTFGTGMQQPSAEDNPGNYYNLDGVELLRDVSPNVLAGLPGRIPGLLADPSTGNSLGLAFHGRNTLYANNAPYFILNGFVNFGNWQDVNPNDIDSMSVLKDAVAGGIWGPFSANGVVVMTTKSGHYKDSLLMTLTMNYSVSGKPSLYYVPQISPASYIGMEEQLFQQGYYAATLSNPTYPAVTPVVALLSEEQNQALSKASTNANINYLSRFDTRHELLTYFYRPSINQQYHFSISNGNKQQHYYLSAGYDHVPTDLRRNVYDRYTLNANYSAQLIPRRLELTTIFQFTATSMLNNNPGSLPVAYPYGPLADSKGNPLPINYKYNQNYIDTAGGGRLLDWHYLPLQELALADNATHRYAGFLQMRADYQLSKTLTASASYRYSQSVSLTNNFYSQNSFYARDLINQFSEINGSNVIYPVPLGNMQYHSDTGWRADNFRGQLTFATADSQHRWIAMAGVELDDLIVTGQDRWLYRYDPRTGSSASVDFANFYPNYVTGDMQQVPGNGPPLGLNNRYLSGFSNVSYTIKNEYSFYGALRKDATNIVGAETNKQWSPFWSLGVGWEITRNHKQPSKYLPLLKWRLTYGCNGNIGDRIAALQTQNLGLNLYGSPQSGVASPPNPDLSWERTYVLNTGLDFALLQDTLSRLGRISGSLDTYLKWSDRLLGSDTLPPSAGLATFFGNTAGMRGYGLDLVLNSDNIRGRFQWTSRLLLSWAVDHVSRYLLQPQYPSAYVSGSYPKVGEPSTALFAYRWAGLDSSNGNPRGYLNGQPSTDYLSIMNQPAGGLRVRGSYEPLVFGSLVNTFRWKGWALSAMLLFKADYWIRRPSIDYNRMITGLYPGDKDYDQRWMAPGDERKTTVPSFPAINDPNRDLFYQNSDVLVTRGDQLRWQDLRVDYTLLRHAHHKEHWQHINIYADVTGLGILWRANHYGIDPDAASFGTLPVTRTYSAGIRLNY
jgi:TonB-dependent SusC/RagA subfamily outer membrane receptor